MNKGFKAKPTDLWSVGVCLYTFITQKLPFNGESDLEIQIKAKDTEPEYPPTMTQEVKDLIKKLLKKDPNQRPTISEALDHHWFHSVK